MSTQSWFDVDRKGLAKLLKGRPKAFILYELLQNAWDANSTVIGVGLEFKNRAAEIIVEDDDPEGFADLAHAYTMFAESAKKADPEKRGRFNLGEKLVLALAKEATITTTKGTVIFDENGRHHSKKIRKVGSSVSLTVPMTKSEFEELVLAAQKVLPPKLTGINGKWLDLPRACCQFIETLPTIVADEEGVLRRTARRTTVRLYEPRPGEIATLYEMGIPVVETGDRFHVDISQKVPLNTDRDNVTPEYLREVRAAVLNWAASSLTKADSTETWVKDACSSKKLTDEAIKQTFELRFGSDAVAYDPSDPEANKLSTASGRTVVHGGSLSAAEWENTRRAGILRPAGQVTPSPKPFHPDGEPLKLMLSADWTPSMKKVANLAFAAAVRVLGHPITVQMTNDPQWPFNATYGDATLIFNVGRLGYEFFKNQQKVIDLLIHEFGHEYAKDHLSEDYYDGLTLVGSKLVVLALEEPELFR